MKGLFPFLGDEDEEEEANRLKEYALKTDAWLTEACGGLVIIIDEPCLSPGAEWPVNPGRNPRQISEDEYHALREIALRVRQKGFVP